MTHNPSRKALTPRQIRTLNEVLAIGAARPHCPEDLADRLEQHLRAGTQEAMATWTQRSLYLTKNMLFTALRCEGQFIADLNRPRTGLHPATVVGIIAHRAIQLNHTHPGRTVAENVRESLAGARGADSKLDLWWEESALAVQSDVLAQAVSRVTTFMDDWPPLEESWSPRFEEPLAAKVGALTLSSRADLIIGRPRADLRQTLLLVDLKSGNLKDDHYDEAMFYALVATLRHRVAPWRSLVYSLASGEYTTPDVTVDSLMHTADQVIKGTKGLIETMTEQRAAELLPGDHCRWCVLSNTCPSAQLTDAPVPIAIEATSRGN